MWIPVSEDTSSPASNKDTGRADTSCTARCRVAGMDRKPAGETQDNSYWWYRLVNADMVWKPCLVLLYPAPFQGSSYTSYVVVLTHVDC